MSGAKREIQHKEFGGPQDPPLFEGKRGPKHKEFAGSGGHLGGGGLGGGVSAQILYVYALFWFLKMPDIENSRKTDEKTAELVPDKVPGKNSRTTAETTEKQQFCLFWLFVQLFVRLFSRHFIWNPLGCFFGRLGFYTELAPRPPQN